MSKQVHVMQVLHTLEIGGAEKLAYDISRKFKKGFAFSFFCLDGLGELADRIVSEGGNVYCFGRKGGWDFALIKKFAALCTEKEVDIIQAHQYTPYFYSVLASLFSKRRPRVIFTEHGRHQPDKVRWKRVIFNRIMLPFTHAITGVAQFSKDSLVWFEKISASRIQVIYNGIDLKNFPAKYNKTEKRKKIDIADEEQVIGIIARLDPIKDHKTLINAFALIRKNNEKSKLFIVGDGPERLNLEKQVNDLALTSSVIFMGMRSDVPDILMALDVFVLPSIMEAMSVTLLEAMSASLPVVATDVGGNREVVLNGKTGELVPVTDAERLAEAICSILFDSKKAQAMGKAGRQRVEMMFTFEKMLDNYEKLYREIL
ncbi:MAG: GT4 family glycosyltransferase PelF [Candidatus Auribacterota bacterium]